MADRSSAITWDASKTEKPNDHGYNIEMGLLYMKGIDIMAAFRAAGTAGSICIKCPFPKKGKKEKGRDRVRRKTRRKEGTKKEKALKRAL